MANIKVFADKETDKWTGKKLIAPDLSMPGIKKKNLRSRVDNLLTRRN